MARQVHLSLLFARKGQKLPLRAPWALLLLRLLLLLLMLLLLRLLLLLLMLLLLLSVRCGLAVSSRANVAGLGVRGAGASHVEPSRGRDEVGHLLLGSRFTAPL